MMTKITIPCHWHKKTLEKILIQNSQSKDIKIEEIYGCLARGPVAHGRAPKAVLDIGRKKAIEFRKYVKSMNLHFTYLINAPFNFNSGKKKKEVKRYIDWIINDFKADSLMLTSYELMKFIRESYLDVPIHISTIAGIKNAKQLEKFLDINPSRVVPHHDVNRNFKDLKNLIKKASDWKIEIELMATESCLRGCPNREAHYQHLSGGKADEPFHTVCNTDKLMFPRELLKANFIRPEDLNIYERLGVSFFKITGRSKPSVWLPEVAEAYLKRKYSGNLIRLLGIDPSLRAENWVFLNNKALDGFLSKFPKSGDRSKENLYCDRWIYKLYQKGQFKLKNGSKYKLNDSGSLYCYELGINLISVINKEKIEN